MGLFKNQKEFNNMKHYSLLANMFRYPENSYKMQMGELNEFLKTNYPDVISTFNSFYNQLSDTNKINEEYYLKTFEIEGICCMCPYRSISVASFKHSKRRTPSLVRGRTEHV